MHASGGKTDVFLLNTCSKCDPKRSQTASLSIGVTPTSVAACARWPLASLNPLLAAMVPS